MKWCLRFWIPFGIFVFTGIAQEVHGGAGRSIRGRIVDDLGNPVPDVEVEFKAPVFLQPFEKKVKSDKEGKFLVEALPERVCMFCKPQHFHANPERMDENWKRLEKREPFRFFRLSGGESRDVGDLVFDRVGALVSGTLRGADGEPEAGAEVWLSLGFGRYQSWAVTDEKGRFRVRSFDTFADTPAHVLHVYRQGAELPVAFERGGFPIWRETSVDLVLPKVMGVLSVKVSLGGKPVPDARAYLYLEGQMSKNTFFPPRKTGENGEAAWKGLPAGKYEVWALGKGIPRTSFSVTCPGEDLELNIEKSLWGTVEGYAETRVDGRFLTPEESMLEGEKKTVFLCNGEGELHRPVVPVAFFKKDGRGVAFEVGNLIPGEYRFQVRDCSPSAAPRPPKDGPKERWFACGSFHFEPWNPGGCGPTSREAWHRWVVRVARGEKVRIESSVTRTKEDLMKQLEKMAPK